jgi:hypothetical protein
LNARFYYGGIGVRPMADVDILVRRSEVLRAARILGEGNWTAHFEDLGKLLL